MTNCGFSCQIIFHHSGSRSSSVKETNETLCWRWDCKHSDVLISESALNPEMSFSVSSVSKWRWTLLMWTFNVSCLEDLFGQWGHIKGLIPVWVAMCRSSICLRFLPVNSFLQIEQCTVFVGGCSPHDHGVNQFRSGVPPSIICKTRHFSANETGNVQIILEKRQFSEVRNCHSFNWHA